MSRMLVLRLTVRQLARRADVSRETARLWRLGKLSAPKACTERALRRAELANELDQAHYTILQDGTIAPGIVHRRRPLVYGAREDDRGVWRMTLVAASAEGKRQ